MSTRKTREALDLMKEIQGYSTADIYEAAIKEVEAIEKTAALYCKRGKTMEEATEVDRALVSIAEDAP